MHFDVLLLAAETLQDQLAFQSRWFIQQHGTIGGVLPASEIIHQLMLLRILMYVGDDTIKLSIIVDHHSPEGVLEQAAGAVKGQVYGLGIRIEKV